MPAKTRHLAAITEPIAVGQLLRAVDSYQGVFTVKCALGILPPVFTRVGELRGMTWAEIDFDSATWRIPGERMKMKIGHIVPLSQQVIGILREIQPLTGEGRLVFPSERTTERPISENSLKAALRRLGYPKEQV